MSFAGAWFEIVGACGGCGSCSSTSPISKRVRFKLTMVGFLGWMQMWVANVDAGRGKIDRKERRRKVIFQTRAVTQRQHEGRCQESKQNYSLNMSHASGAIREVRAVAHER